MYKLSADTAYREVSNQKAEVQMLQGALSSASANQAEMSAVFRATVDESHEQLVALKAQCGREATTAHELQMAKIQIEGLNRQLRVAND